MGAASAPSMAVRPGHDGQDMEQSIDVARRHLLSLPLSQLDISCLSFHRRDGRHDTSFGFWNNALLADH